MTNSSTNACTFVRCKRFTVQCYGCPCLCEALTIICIFFSIATAETVYGVWSLRRYVDEFQEETGNIYATNTYFISGTFSNSVATDSPAYMALVIDYYFTTIELYEYSTSSRVKNSGNTQIDYTVKLRANGDTYTFDGFMYSGGSSIIIDNPHLFDDCLANNSSVSVYIETKNTTIPNTYLFSSFETTGFLDVIPEVYGSYPEIYIAFDKNKIELNQPITAYYRISSGYDEYRHIFYVWSVFDGTKWADVSELEELNSLDGYISFTPTDGLGVAFFMYVWDSPKMSESKYYRIYLPSTWLDLPEGTTRIESEAFAYMANIIHINIPDSVIFIANDAFVGNGTVILYGRAGGIAEEYAASHANCYFFEN